MKFLFLILVFCFVTPSSFANNLKLEFQIDEDFLICHTVSKSTSHPFPDTVANFRKELESTFSSELKFLRELDEVTPNILLKEHSRLEKMLKIARTSPFFPQLLTETKVHLEQTRSEWDSNFARTLPYMASLTKITMNKTMKVFITHPEVFQGRYLGGNVIAWGRKSEWKNYATVYLWHEILHSLLKFNDKSHALIELVSDDALRVFLNGGAFPPFTKDGHEKLIKNKQWIFDHYWKAYLSNNSKNILQLEDDLLWDTKF